MENEFNNPPPMSTKDWLITILLTAIPIVNIVLLFVWAFGSQFNPSKSNWAKATLIWFAIIIVLYMLLAMTFGMAFLFLD